ncbi:MAG: hypothetical protein U0270_25940 [Labilithrix sp.]
MALFTDPRWNAATNRAELHFVNQQYDLVMRICWSDAAGDYAFDVEIDEANRLGRSWGATDFDAVAELARQRPRLRSMKPPKK